MNSVELGNGKFPWSMKINSIVQFGNRVAVRQKTVPDPSTPLIPGRELPDVAYQEGVTVYDCENPIMATAESTIISKSGETLYHYKWADPRYLDLSIGVAIAPGTVSSTARKIVCHDELRTPTFGKKQLAAMNFASLASTREGDGDMFYVPIEHSTNVQDVREAILIIRLYKDVGLALPGISVQDLPNYRVEVDRVRLKCSGNEIAITKSEYFDVSNNPVYLTGADPSTPIQWTPFIESSPLGVLQRIVCPNEFGGLGVEVSKDGTLIKG